ncbi:MAG: hypothetical protein ACK56W_18975 [Pirellula sp.]|jgi:hypothetical protein|nr:hypothetical protein [Pirellula sp.]
MSNDARHRDIAALLAKGVIRGKKRQTVAKKIESPIQTEQDISSVNNDSEASQPQSENGGDQ